MNRAPALLLFLLSLFSLPGLAQGVDIAVRIDADPREARLRAGYGIHVQWDAPSAPADVVLTVDVSAPIRDLYVWDQRMTCTTTENRIQCTLPPAAGQYDAGFFLDLAPTTPGTYAVTASVTSTTPDPHPENNSASASVEVLGLPLLRAEAYSVDAAAQNAADPGRPSILVASVQNDGEAATNVVLHVTLPAGGSFLGILESEWFDGQCDVKAEEVVCQLGLVPSFDYRAIRIRYLPPDRDDGGTFPVRVEATAAEPDAESWRNVVADFPLRRRFNVDSVANEGSGSLRQAMLDATANCAATPCLIAFRNAGPFRPTDVLPELSGFIKIDGGDTRVEIDGSALQSGDAFRSRACELRVANLAVRNFPGHAFEPHVASGCGYAASAGFFLSNSELTGNLRGVVLKGVYARISGNTIRDNARAGIFVDGGIQLYIEDNTISGNGASGVFLNLSEHGPYSGVPAMAWVRRNVIHDNHEWGVCRTRNGWIEIAENSIAGNVHYAIDVDLDFESPDRPDDPLGIPNKPVIVSATYDAAVDKTIVRVDAGPLGGRVDVYASDSLSGAGYPQADRYVGSMYPGPGRTLEIAGDLRGQWLTATLTRSLSVDWTSTPFNTSELSHAVQVR